MHVCGGCKAPYDTRESVSEEARALQMGARVQRFESHPCHVPFPLTGAKEALLLSGTESDLHVSKPTFRVESENCCLRDLNRQSSRSKTIFVFGQATSTFGKR